MAGVSVGRTLLSDKAVTADKVSMTIESGPEGFRRTRVSDHTLIKLNEPLLVARELRKPA